MVCRCTPSRTTRGTTRRPIAEREGLPLNSKPFPSTQTIRKSHGGGRAHRGKMHFAPHHRSAVVNIATSRFRGHRPDGSHRPASFVLAEYSVQNLCSFCQSGVIQPVPFTFSFSRIRDERRVLGDRAGKARRVQAALFSRTLRSFYRYSRKAA